MPQDRVPNIQLVEGSTYLKAEEEKKKTYKSEIRGKVNQRNYGPDSAIFARSSVLSHQVQCGYSQKELLKVTESGPIVVECESFNLYVHDKQIELK